MSAAIQHEGKIVRIDQTVTEVEIMASSACGSCHAKSLCGVSESVSKIITVPTDPYETYSVGETVKVCVRQSMGLKAVWISYTIPLIVLMSFILGLHALGVGELLTAVGAIAAVGLYYLIIYLCRNSLASECVFTIKKI